MNWFDIVIIAIIAVGAFMGMRTGLIGAGITAIGGIIGWLIAGRLSDKVGGLFGDSLSGDTIATVITYVIIIAIALFIARIVARIVRPILSIATLGLSSMVDKLGGLALGLLLGLAISGAFIVVTARFAYNFELLDEGVIGAAVASIPSVQDALGSVGTVGAAATSIPDVQSALDSVEGAVKTAGDSIAVVQDTRDSIEGALTASAIVSVFINIATALPGDTLGFVPEDFRVSLEILDQAIEAEE
ncbi:MAG: CvpA family protein [Chloroflexi bacterium]|nr:CvpA family protein [Chloroflexota bacterium]